MHFYMYKHRINSYGFSEFYFQPTWLENMLYIRTYMLSIITRITRIKHISRIKVQMYSYYSKRTYKVNFKTRIWVCANLFKNLFFYSTLKQLYRKQKKYCIISNFLVYMEFVAHMNEIMWEIQAYHIVYINIIDNALRLYKSIYKIFLVIIQVLRDGFSKFSLS